MSATKIHPTLTGHVMRVMGRTGTPLIAYSGLRALRRGGVEVIGPDLGYRNDSPGMVLEIEGMVVFATLPAAPTPGDVLSGATLILPIHGWNDSGSAQPDELLVELLTADSGSGLGVDIADHSSVTPGHVVARIPYQTPVRVGDEVRVQLDGLDTFGPQSAFNLRLRVEGAAQGAWTISPQACDPRNPTAAGPRLEDLVYRGAETSDSAELVATADIYAMTYRDIPRDVILEILRAGRDLD